MTVTATDSGFDDHLARVIGAIDTATGLPNGVYTDPAAFEREKTAAFHSNWACIGFAGDVPEIGDAMPVHHLGIPLVIVRSDAVTVRVFQNVCRHRGMILVDRPGPVGKLIRCPYHAWAYDLDGALRATPHAGGPGIHQHARIARDVSGLLEVRAHVFLGAVFVNVDGAAPAFDDVHAGLIERWAPFATAPLYHGGPDSSFSLEVACNWKLAVENYCEAYHLPFVHPGLNAYSRLEDHYNIIETGYAGQGTTVYRPQLSDDGGRFALFDRLESRWDTGAEYVALYPNTLLGVHKDHVYVIRLEPLSPTTTRERVQIYYADKAMTGPRWAAMRATNAAMWKDVFVEDIFAVQGMQQGRQAVGFDGGIFSPVMDAPTHAFHAWVASCLRAG